MTNNRAWRSPRVDTMGTRWPREEHVAFRLAGQAVVARALGISVNTVATREKPKFSGQVKLATQDYTDMGAVLQTELEWRERYIPDQVFEEVSPSGEAIAAHILIRLSGETAERYFCGQALRPRSEFRDAYLGRLFALYPCNRETMKGITAMLVQCHRDAILRVACHLVVPTSLNGEGLDGAITGPDF